MEFIFYQAQHGDVYSAMKYGGVAIMSSLFNIGKHNTELEKIIKRIPGIIEPGNEEPINDQLKVNELYGGSSYLKTFYTYNGSRTMPPCSEGVKWIILSKNYEISSQQFEKFKLIHLSQQIRETEKNWRPTIPLKERKVIKFSHPPPESHEKKSHEKKSNENNSNEKKITRKKIKRK